ncbi:hypothetical protein LUZ63_018862 [Rhynchospora breviuscula]|uniref:Uncharacterized protein n=1 Tax=Rhynchospora breviuscula TaxID=2022672 RepID=A0A9Q0C590_9POAL|nr:hypothetical protein LUZ63_018862 [Rhynchospora breviuscula]
MEQTLPLLNLKATEKNSTDTPIQKTIGQTFKSTAHLTKLLPTGTVLTYQYLVPVFTNQGRCSPLDQHMTCWLIALCALSCFFLSFTDSFRDQKGTVRYGLATTNGFWVIDGSDTVPQGVAAGYRIRFIDFIHAVVSMFIFVAVAMFDQNVMHCLYPVPSEDTKKMLTALPVVIGVVGSSLFVTFPTTRHGIGYPISPH